MVLASCTTNPKPPPVIPPPPEAHKDKAFTEFFRRTSGWIAGDGATSVPLSDGRVLWFFGDSHMDDFDATTGTIPCLFQVRNAAMLQDKNDLQHPQTLLNTQSEDKSFFRHPADSTLWFWPGAGFQSGDTVYVYLTSLQKTAEGGQWGFRAVGHYLGKLAFPEIKIIGYVALPSFDGVEFGCGFVSDSKSGFTYAFGNRKNFTSSDVFVARFPTKNPGSDWVYWDGGNWSSNVTEAAVIARGASTSVSVCKVKNKFVLTTSEFSVACDQGKDIYISISSSPAGPFSPLKKIFTVDDIVQGHFPFFYLPAAHPEFINADNELLVTYCINGYEPSVSSCTNGRANPDYYRPRAIRIPLKLIDPNF